MSSNNDDISSLEVVAAATDDSSLEVVASGKSAATDDINTKGIKEYYYCIYLLNIIYIINYCYCVYNRIITDDAKDKEITKRMRI